MINFCKLLDASTGVLDRHLAPPDISERRKEAGKVIWIDLQEPTDGDSG